MVKSSWDDAATTLAAKVAEGGVAVLASTNSSPTLARLGAEMKGAGVRWAWWSPVTRDNSQKGAEIAFGRTLRALRPGRGRRRHHARLRLPAEPPRCRAPREPLREAAHARGGEHVPPLHGREPVHLDRRHGRSPSPVRSADVGAILEMIAGGSGGALDGNAKAKAFVAPVQADIAAAGKKVAIIVGESGSRGARQGPRAPPDLGSMGTTLHMIDEPLAGATTDGLASLVADMNSGAVKTLLMLGGNPVYDAPADLDFAGALAKVTSVHLSLYRRRDRGWRPTGTCRWRTGSSAGATPGPGTARTTWPSRSSSRSTAGRARSRSAPRRGSDARATGAPRCAPPSTPWVSPGAPRRASVRRSTTASPRGRPRRKPTSVTASASLPAIPAAAAGTEVTFFPARRCSTAASPTTAGCRSCPDFTTKMTWDNAALDRRRRPPRAMGVSTGDMVKVTLDRRSRPRRSSPRAGRGHVAISRATAAPAAGVVAGSDKAEAWTRRFDAYPIRTTGGMDPVGRGATVAPRPAALRRSRRPRSTTDRRDRHEGHPRAPPQAGHGGHRGAVEGGPELRRARLPRARSSSSTRRSTTRHVPVGHDDRSLHLQRLQRLRHRVPVGEQHPDRRQGAGQPRP